MGYQVGTVEERPGCIDVIKVLEQVKLAAISSSFILQSAEPAKQKSYHAAKPCH